jgi:hypothetical protein
MQCLWVARTKGSPLARKTRIEDVPVRIDIVSIYPKIR